MIPEPSFEPQEPFIRPFVDFALVGEGFRIEQKGIALNPVGPTKIRFVIEEGNPFERYTLEAQVYEGKLADINAHTWNAEGHHLDLFGVKDLEDGQTYEKDAEIVKDGVKIAFALSLKYYVK